MVSALAERSASVGVGPVSLNFAMFREAFERGAEIGAGPVARLWRQALLLASRNWQLESLYRSNAKYQPAWQPRFICFEYASDLPRVGAAAGSAEGFLTRPSLSRLLRRRGRRRRRRAGPAPRWSTPPSVAALIPPPPDLVAAAMAAGGCPSRSAYVAAKVERLRARGHRPLPGHLPAHPHPGRGPDRGRRARPGHLDRAHGSPSTGRVMLKRDLGGLGFATLRDGSGDLQVMVDAGRVGPELHDLWRHDIDLGDQVGVTGEVITTRQRRAVRRRRRRCRSRASRCDRCPTSTRGSPTPRRGSAARYVDLIVRPEARDDRLPRSTVVRSIRDSPARARLHRGRDPDPAADPRRRERPAVRDPHQRLRPRSLPADRHRAPPQAAAGRRDGEGLRGGPAVPQRGRGLQAQPGVHLAGGLRDLRRLPLDAGAHPGADPGGGDGRLRRAGRSPARRRRHGSSRSTSRATGR